MKLKLTDAEFSLLVDLAYAGDWVINSFRLSEAQIKCYQDIKKRLMSILAKKQKRKYDDEEYIDDEIHDKLDGYFKFYSEQAMLKRLATCLAEYEHGKEKSLERAECEDEYRAEFAANGVKNVKVNLANKF